MHALCDWLLGDMAGALPPLRQHIQDRSCWTCRAETGPVCWLPAHLEPALPIEGFVIVCPVDCSPGLHTANYDAHA